MMQEFDEAALDAWLIQVKQRNLDGVFITALDVIEPVAPLVAQVLWVLQPAAGIFGSTAVMHTLAERLDAPEGVEFLRRRLRDDLD